MINYASKKNVLATIVKPTIIIIFIFLKQSKDHPSKYASSCVFFVRHLICSKSDKWTNYIRVELETVIFNNERKKRQTT